MERQPRGGRVSTGAQQVRSVWKGREMWPAGRRGRCLFAGQSACLPDWQTGETGGPAGRKGAGGAPSRRGRACGRASLCASELRSLSPVRYSVGPADCGRRTASGCVLCAAVRRSQAVQPATRRPKRAGRSCGLAAGRRASMRTGRRSPPAQQPAARSAPSSQRLAIGSRCEQRGAHSRSAGPEASTKTLRARCSRR